MKVLFANLAALIVLLGDFGSLHHFLVVRHKLCAEHGKFEHIGITSSGDGQIATLPISSDQEDHSDSGCHHKHLQFKQSHMAAIEIRFEQTAYWDVLIAPERDVTYISVAILHAAPKNSPPSHAV